MNYRFKSWFILMVIVTMLFSSMPAGFAASTPESPDYSGFKDVANHWAQSEINKWSGKGLINGYNDDLFKPDASITRAEFIAMLGRVFGYQALASIHFTDVKESDWYYVELAQAVAAGVVNGYDDHTFRPKMPITRQEAAVIIARAFKLSAVSNAAIPFVDEKLIASWSKEAVQALVEGGYVAGRNNGAFDPLASITRAETVKMLSNVAGDVKNKANTYSGTIATNLVVNTPDVILKDMTIQGDLYIAPGSGEGNVKLDQVIVKGRTIIEGGGENSIVINDSILEGTVIVNKLNGKLRIVATGMTNIPDAQLFSGAYLQESNLTGDGFGNIQVVQIYDDSQVIKLEGDFNHISIGAFRANVYLLKGTAISIDINDGLTGAMLRIEEGAIVSTLTANSPASIQGKGTIKNAIIVVNGVQMEMIPEQYAIALGVTANIAGKIVSHEDANSGGSVDQPGNGGNPGPGTDPGGGTDPDDNEEPSEQATAVEIAKSITAVQAPEKGATALVMPAVPSGYTVSIKSSSNEGVISLNGTITPQAVPATIELVFEVTRLSDHSKATTAPLAVIVPAKTIARNTDIEINDSNLNFISEITEDTIDITAGGTYLYTVDTEEGAGFTILTIDTVEQLLDQITSKTSAVQNYTVKNNIGVKNLKDPIVQDDILNVTAGQESRDYTINVVEGALRGKMELVNHTMTANTPSDVVLNFFAGMRSPATEVVLKVPKGIHATMDNTFVNVIGRGDVKLSGLDTQSIGRTGAGYRFQQVGTVSIDDNADGSQVITFKGLDFRPSNGADLQITFQDVTLGAGNYPFEASYKTSEPVELTSPWGGTNLEVVNTISDFNRILDKSLTYKEVSDTYTKAGFNWSPAQNADSIQLLVSTDKGFTWQDSGVAVKPQSSEIEIADLKPDTEYYFKLAVSGGENQGDSNIAKFYTGKFNAKLMGAVGDGKTDDTQAINDAILYLNSLGGGTLLFDSGTFNVRTVHLQSNVYLYINKSATIAAIKGGDAPETTYFSDKGYRSGTSATSTGPYKDPENYMTKQDVGHHYFRNSMFFGERIDNFKIIGNGRITGNGNLQTSDGVMNNSQDNRVDKMVTVKLCTNFEFGGLDNGMDLWYEETNSPTTDEPYYIKSIDADGSNEVRETDIGNMLRVDRAGHFAMLATGTDYINTHDFYYDKNSSGGARDVFDYMQSSYVTARNIYAKGVSDDIVKPGSDSSLGFTRPATTYYIRNIIGDTNCNLFQIGSETVDDIKNIYIDNIYVLAGNKAGFSISTNDGAHIENIYLNYGLTGIVHHKSEMRRTRAPFFISISNRGRVIGGDAVRMKFMENGKQRDELLSTNVNIGRVKNIYIKDVNIEEVYQGSQYGDPSKRWVKYTNQNKATPIIAGYKVGEGGPVLPDGRNIGYIENLNFENVDVLVKGGNKFSDTEIIPPELGVGKYNVADIGEQPSYGFWARHVDGLNFKNVTTNFENNDDRYAIVLDDVKNATIDKMTMVSGKGNPNVIQLKNASNITVINSSYYQNTWGNELTALDPIENVTVATLQTYPQLRVQDPRNTLIQIKQSGHSFLSNVDHQSYTISAVLGTTVEDMAAHLESTDETLQTYSVTNASHEAKPSGALVNGDLLVVTAQDETTTQNYTIHVSLEVLLKADTQVAAVKKSSGTVSTSSTNGISYLQTSSLAANEWIEFDIHVPVAGTYDVSFQYKTNTTGRATVQPYVNGAIAGSPVNMLNSTANLFIPVDLGRVEFTAAGTYPVRFVVTSPGVIVVDYIKLLLNSNIQSNNTAIKLKASGHTKVLNVDLSAFTINVIKDAAVEQVLEEITSVDGSEQSYRITESDGETVKASGAVESGNQLIVTAADGITTSSYTIEIAETLSSSTEITFAPDHADVLAIDTNEHRIGIIGNTATVSQLKAQIQSQTGSAQTYEVTNAANAAQADGTRLVSWFKLIVTAADGVTTAVYTISIGALTSNTFVQVKQASHPDIAAIYLQDLSVIAYRGITGNQLLAQIESTDVTKQSYALEDAGGNPIVEAKVLEAGDRLTVTSQDQSANLGYTVLLLDAAYDLDTAPAALASYVKSGGTTSEGADITNSSSIQNSAMNGSHLQLAVTAAGQWIEFSLDVAVEGDYDVILGFKKNNNRAFVQLTSIDDQPVNSIELNQYVNPTTFTGMYTANIADSVHLDKGVHTFRFTAINIAAGKNLSFDFIGLIKK